MKWYLCGAGIALGNLGVAHKGLGETREVIKYNQQRLASAREFGYLRAEGFALGNRVYRQRSRGDAQSGLQSP